MACIYNIKPEDRHCGFCSAYCNDRDKSSKTTEIFTTTNVNILQELDKMKQKDKELLLKDLCTRLPYMPKIKIIYQQQGIKGTDEGNVSCDFIEKIVNDLRNGIITDMQIYLRPMSSMTEEEKEEYKKVCELDTKMLANHPMNGEPFPALYNSQDWLDAHYFDYRGLIPMGLAIEVTEDNNPYKTK